MVMKCSEGSEIIADRYEPCALMGASQTIAGIIGSATVLHAPGGCNITAVHLRSDQVPDGTYTPVISSGLLASDYITGGKDILIKTIRDVFYERMKGTKLEAIWIVCGCATAIIGDDIIGAAHQVEREAGIKVIAVDCPGFSGGFSKGAENVYNAIIDNFVSRTNGEQKGINLVGPNLMGSKNWPNDLPEMIRLLESADIKVNLVLSHNTKYEDLPKFSQAEANYILTYEEMPDFQRRSQELNIECWGQDLVLPIGVANTEEWFLKVAEKFGDVEKARQQMRKDTERIMRILKGNYNASWMLSFLSAKQAGVYGFTSFASSFARYLFYDLNVKPRVIALVGSTKASIESAKKLLEDMASYLDFEVLENPTYYEYGKKLKEAKVDFSIGQRQDKALSEGLGITHRSLGGFYFWNQFNFYPSPYFGIMGTLTLLSEMSELVEDTFYEKDVWKQRAYKSREEKNKE